MDEEKIKSMFEEFLGKSVKIPYQDGDSLRTARGVLESEDDNFLKVRGKLGTLIIAKKTVIKIGLEVGEDGNR